MTPPKFSVGERVVYVGSLEKYRRPQTVTGIQWVTGYSQCVSTGEGRPTDCWHYYTDLVGPNEFGDGPVFRGYAEQCLRPLPPEKKSTWDDFEEIVKWRPVEVVV